MRDIVYQRLSTDTTVTTLIPKSRMFIYSDLKTVPAEKPLLTCRFGPIEPQVKEGTAFSRVLRIWVHDVPGDYTRIDSVLDAIRESLRSLTPTAENKVLQIRWVEGSEDLPEDPEMGTISRFDRYRITHT